MASVINKNPNPTTLQYTYLDSVNTPDYDPAYWLHNPDVHDLVNSEVPRKYWKPEEYDNLGEMDWHVIEMSDEEKAAVEAAIPTPQPQPVSLPDEMRDKSGKLRVHQTSRNDGLAIHWTGRGDDRNDARKFGNGNLLSYKHEIGDSTSHIAVSYTHLRAHET